MTCLDSIEASARHVEHIAARFASALRTLIQLVAPLQARYRLKITHDGPTCVMVDLIDAQGREAGLSVDAEFEHQDILVHLLFDGPNRDKAVRQIKGEDLVARGLEQVVAFLERPGLPPGKPQ